MTNKNDKSSKYCHVEDPNYVEPEVTFTTASTETDPWSLIEQLEDECERLRDQGVDGANRFDPFEALDGILQAITEYGANSKAQERAEDYLYALRAYTTGTERWLTTEMQTWNVWIIGGVFDS